jgi:hypothetical protein
MARTPDKRFRDSPPDASALVESLRGLGYSVPTAIADIIDNSISAGATLVNVDFTWAGEQSRITIRDNGSGMSENELEHAMRLGASNPLAQRSAHDLGRFGMGLKTASFSHCRRLTVASKQDGRLSCFRWDLDELARAPTGGWFLYEGPAEGSEGLLVDVASQEKGTLVLWECLDRIVTEGYTADDFADLLERVEEHLSMVFHRLIEDRARPLTIDLNGRAVTPWDPFLVGLPAKPWESPQAPRLTQQGLVVAQCHVLPHQDRISAEIYKRASGPGGWTAQQGFYVYRNRRMLMSGGWLGLGSPRAWSRDEIHRLARISVEIPNTADAAWKIDIRKSTARIPATLRPWLMNLANETRERARRVFAYRGEQAGRAGNLGTAVQSAWRAEHLVSGVRYRIDTRHSAVGAVLECCPDRELVLAMLRIVEETVPVQRIWLDTAETGETPRTSFSGEQSDQVTAILRTMFADLTKRRGMDAETAKRLLRTTEPFQHFPELIELLADGNSGPE